MPTRTVRLQAPTFLEKLSKKDRAGYSIKAEDYKTKPAMLEETADEAFKANTTSKTQE